MECAKGVSFFSLSQHLAPRISEFDMEFIAKRQAGAAVHAWRLAAYFN
jgi:hypothetical protein